MTNEQITDAVLAWVRAAVPELEGGYDHEPAFKDQALPDVVVALGFERIVRQDERFPIFALQQVAALRVFEIGFSFMVEAGETEAQAAAAAAQLRAFAELAIVSVCDDHTLGGRVSAASPEVEFDYTRPFVQYGDDGPRGREMIMQMAVAEPLLSAD